MKDKRFSIGMAGTVAWIFVLICFLFWKRCDWSEMKLSQWGDVFAGFSAPLAFLWLVLGYRQQGEELRLSSEALRLQAEELKNSVEQQSKLVDVSRMQLEADRKARDAEQVRIKMRVRPIFMFEIDGNSSVLCKNHGVQVTNVKFTVTNERKDLIDQCFWPVVDTVTKYEVSPRRPISGSSNYLKIDYQDQLGNLCEENHEMRCRQNGILEFGRIN